MSKQRLQTQPSAPARVSLRDMEMAEQWWFDHLDDPRSNEDFSALWILCSLIAQARFEGERDPTPGWSSKWGALTMVSKTEGEH